MNTVEIDSIEGTDAEYSVIGGLLLDNSRYQEIDIVPDDFNDKSLSMIYESIIYLINTNTIADVVTVSNHLQEKTKRNWLPLVGTFAKNTPSAANISAYAQIVKTTSKKRKASQIAELLKKEVWSDESVIDKSIRDLLSLDVGRIDHECDIRSVLIQTFEKLDNADSEKLPGIATELKDLDNLLCGLHPGDLIIVAARPSMGKTSFLLNLSTNSKVSCGIISGEQGREEVSARLLASTGDVNSYRLRSRKLRDDDWSKLSYASSKLSEKNIVINDKPAPNIVDISRQARRWHFNNNIKILLVDYIQRIRANDKQARHEQIEEICRTLKELARELQIPVVALSQVNRNVENREDKRPYMSDLKDGGAIEQEADCIITIYRDEVYNPNTLDKGIAELNVLKQRNGPIGMIKASWKGEYMRFDNLYQDDDYE